MNIANNLERATRLFPDKTALIFEGWHFSYRELDDMSNRVANALTDLGISAGDRVALFLPNIPAFITLYFGIQKVGAIAVTLNSSLKSEEIQFILNDCEAKVVATTASLRDRIPAQALPHLKQILIAEGDAEDDILLSDLVAEVSSTAQAISLRQDAPSVILYTSGTTGFPKGAMLSQGNVVSNVRLTTQMLRLEPNDRTLLFLPAFHNYGQIATLNSCFDAGATLILHREFEMAAILDSIVEHQVTTFFGVPTIYTLLCDHATSDQIGSLRRCISAGATLPLEIAEKWQQKFGLTINEIYGLSECSMVCFNHAVEYRTGSVGTAVDGTEIQLVDAKGQVVPQGELGEVVVQGPSVMLGYWNRPQESAEAIKEGWFHTGDIGRLDEAGYLYIVDRKKDMVNVGGQKVYPTEVEQVLYRHPAVAEAAVYGVPEPILGEQVRAAIVLKAAQRVTEDEIIKFCRQSLADYKLPSVVEVVASLPKGRTGKILKRVLREEAKKRLPKATLQRITRSQEKIGAEKIGAEKIGAEKIGAEKIGAWLTEWLITHLTDGERLIAPDKPFNDYGLTSILAVKMVTAFNQWLGSSFEPIVVWNYPTINNLVSHISQERHQGQKELSRMELWPAIDPYHVYDALMYTRMMGHTERMEKYRLAIQNTVQDKIVLEIGPGQEANLTRMCALAGAKHVYAVELSPQAYQEAQARIKKWGLSNQVTLILGDVTKVKLPERADVCLSSIAGQIGGNEGVVATINNVRNMLKSEATIVPQRYVSKIAAVTLPDDLVLEPQLTPLGQRYAQKIFEQIGHPFDMQVVINHFESSCIVSDAAIFEDLDFSQATTPTTYKHDIRLTITHAQTRLDGLMIWLNLHLIEGLVIDILESPGSWLPVYFPIFHPGVSVSAGDVICATCIGSLSDNGINPDYRIQGRLIRQDGSDIEFDYLASHHGRCFKQHSFYQQLFKGQTEKATHPLIPSQEGSLGNSPLESFKAWPDSFAEDQLKRIVSHQGPEPIAIIGMGCRFPGDADTPQKFWHLLQHGIDTAAKIPAERWDVEAYYDANKDARGKMYVQEGSFLSEVDQFDAKFFGLPPLEANSLDPQQRLLLEVCWEALEDAGMAADSLRHTQTGVYVGSYWDDYSTLNLYSDLADIDAYRTLSSLRGMSAGRLAYLLGLHGPAMQVDTACSSSLLAIHLACQALRNGECSLAIAGGVTLVLSPQQIVALCRMQALSPSGRSKSFAAGANGFGVGEGAGLVILKPLSSAMADGDHVLAVIKGSAVNHDGPSNGLTAPNGLAQEAMLRQALQNAQLSPSQIDYIEAHGTGTELGDPIEVGALSQVFAQNRERPLMIGSVKSNIGHLAGAAGVASLIKVVLAMQHGLIPASLHFDEPNPHIPWAEIPFIVPTEPIPWPDKAKLAGISAFGLTGTNVHLIVADVADVAEAPLVTAEGEREAFERSAHLLTLSGKTEQALAEQVSRYLDYLSRYPDGDPSFPSFVRTGLGTSLADVCYTANTGRVHFEHRLAVVADDVTEVQAKLARHQEGELVNGLIQGQLKGELAKACPERSRRIAFLFPGQGSQYVDMGRELYESHPLFREVLSECDEILQAQQFPLLELLYGADKAYNERLLSETRYTQPALFAIAYALAKVWQSWGIEPTAVIGHSVGEYVAACFAGVFSLEDGLNLIVERALLMQALPQNGLMVAVQADETQLSALIKPYRDRVSIAGLNAPQSVVLSGEREAMNQIISQLEAEGIKCKALTVSHAFHSPLMEPMLAEFGQIAQKIEYAAPKLKLISNVSGRVLTKIKADYWLSHIRQPVRFAQGMATLAEMGIDTFIEVGPKPTLLALGQQTLPKSEECLWLPSLYPKQQGDWSQLLESLAQLHVRGGQVDWQKFDEPYARQKVSLPTYPFQRKRYWIDRNAKSVRGSEGGHPLTGFKIALSHSAEIVFQSSLSTTYPAYLNDHRVFGQAVLPGSAYLEMVLAARLELAGRSKPFIIRNVTFQQPLILSEKETTMQIVFSPFDLRAAPLGEGYRWQIFSQSTASAAWRLHSAGEVVSAPSGLKPAPHYELSALQNRCPSKSSVAGHYLACREEGIDYGPEFQGLAELYEGDGEALGFVRLSEQLQLEGAPYQLHPALLDACLQITRAATNSDETQLPFALEQLRLYETSHHQTAWSYVRLRKGSQADLQQLDITLLSENGELIAELSGLTVRPANRQAILGSSLRTDWLYQLDWQPVTWPQHSPYESFDSNKPQTGRWLIVSDESALAAGLAQQLQHKGEQVDRIGLQALHTPKSPNIRGVASETPRMFGDLGVCCRSPREFLKTDYRGVVYLALPERVDERDMQKIALDSSIQVLALIQMMVKQQSQPRLWLVTQEAIAHLLPRSFAESPSRLFANSAVLWGLGRTVMWEHPELRCSCLDLEAETSVETLFETIWYAEGENQIAIRENKRFVARLTRFMPATTDTLPLNQERSYLITGGLGGLGLKIAAYLAQAGAGHLILASRRGAETERAQEAIDYLSGLGAQVLVVKADVSQEADVARLIEESQRLAPLGGIIHAAGLLDDGILVQQNPERFAKVFAPKVAGSWYLHQQSQEIPLDFFVCFSSQASLLGNPGQSNYAAANAFMDSLMAYRQTQGLPALSINWGGWSEVGLAKDLRGQSSEEAISPQQGVDFFGLLLSQDMAHSTSGQAQVAVLPLKWSRFSKKLPEGTAFPLLSTLIKAKRSEGQAALRLKLNQASAEEGFGILKSHIKAEIELIVGTLPTDEQDFIEMGLDSLMSIQLSHRLSAEMGSSVSVTTILEQPTVPKLARMLWDMLDFELDLKIKHEAIIKEEHQAHPVEAFPQVKPNPTAQYEPFPLSDIQQAYWIGRQSHLELGNVATQVYQEWRRAELDLVRLNQAWQKVMARHPMLRTIIQPDGQQRLLADMPSYQISVLDLQQCEPQIAQERLADVREKMIGRISQADEWPLFDIRVTLMPDWLHLHFCIDMLVVDAWSIELILTEWAEFYHQPEMAFAPLELTFRDYMVTAKAYEEASTLYETSKNYWLNRLDRLPAAPNLPLIQGQQSQARQFEWVEKRLPAPLWEALKRKAAQYSLQPSALLLAVYAEALSLWSKSPHFTLNQTFFHRLPLHPQVNQVVGDFTSVMLTEVDNRREASFIERAKQIQTQVWQDLDHRYFSGVQVIRELNRQSKAPNVALMPVIFTNLLAVDSDERLGWGEPVHQIGQTSQVYLDHIVREVEGGLVLSWSVIEKLFPVDLLADMFASQLHLLKRLATEESAWRENSPLTLPSKQLAQRMALNETQAPISEALLHTLFIDQAQQRPDKVAVIGVDQTLTYRALYQQANQIAHSLREKGAKPNQLVAVVMEKGVEQIVAVMAILMAGAAYLPIDPQLPPERQHYLLTEGEVKLALTQARLAEELSWPEQIQRLVLSQQPAANPSFLGTSLPALETIQRPSDLAYVIYTSGSTGKPKGVMIDHRGAVNTILHINRRFDVTAKDRVLALSALNFDLSVYDIFGLLAVGGTIVMPVPAGGRDPSHWATLMSQHGVTLWNTVPTLMQMLIEYQGRAALHAPLRLVMLSGDWIPLALPDGIRRLWPEAVLISLGGATEASIWSIYYPIKTIDPTWSSIPYGKPLSNQTFHVLNERLEPNPVWVPGQLYIGGIGLALGYWRDEEKSVASFITHPVTGERLYKTGDLGRYLPDGNIEFLGREDFQVKIRGHRIELGEIETHLLKHPAVKETIVSAVGESRHAKQLVAYIVPAENSSHTSQVIDQAAYGLDAQEGMLSDPLERLNFKLNKAGIRQFERARAEVALPSAAVSDTAYLARQSYRQFLADPITLSQLGQLLTHLSPRPFAAGLLPKYRYGSAGSLYPVQTYLYVKPDRVTDLAAGFYYYHPVTHRLVLLSSLSSTATIARSHHAGTNQMIFDQSAFSLFLVAEYQAIEPLYGSNSHAFCLLEAGYMSQLLMMEAPTYELGLCPIGGLEFDPLRAAFALGESQHLLHSFLGGGISAAQKQQRSQLTPQAEPLEEQLKAYLAKKLPRYMVPQLYVQLPELPLTANGKVDRQGLPKPTQAFVAEEIVAPDNEIEENLVGIIQELLQLEQVSTTRNFFDLGATSLNMVHLRNMLKEKFDAELSIVTLFEYSTIKLLARHIKKSNLETEAKQKQGHDLGQARRAARRRRRR